MRGEKEFRLSDDTPRGWNEPDDFTSGLPLKGYTGRADVRPQRAGVVVRFNNIVPVSMVSLVVSEPPTPLVQS